MSTAKPLVALIVTVASLAGQYASACDYGTRSVRYVSYPKTTARIVRSVVVEKPVVSTVSYTTVRKAKVTVAPPAPAHESVEPGQTLRAATNFLGKEVGHVLLQVGNATMPCEVISWQDSSVTFRLPNFGLQHDATARVDLVRPDGRLVRSYHLTLESPGDRLEKVLAVEAVETVPSGATVAPAVAASAGGVELTQAPAAPLAVTSVLVEN